MNVRRVEDAHGNLLNAVRILEREYNNEPRAEHSEIADAVWFAETAEGRLRSWLDKHTRNQL